MYKAAAAKSSGNSIRVQIFFDEESLSGGTLQLRPQVWNFACDMHVLPLRVHMSRTLKSFASQACPLNASNATECSWNEVPQTPNNITPSPSQHNPKPLTGANR